MVKQVAQFIYVAPVVGIVSRYDLEVDACHKNQPNKCKLALYKLLIKFSSRLKRLYISMLVWAAGMYIGHKIMSMPACFFLTDSISIHVLLCKLYVTGFANPATYTVASYVQLHIKHNNVLLNYTLQMHEYVSIIHVCIKIYTSI